ncbi:MAG: NADPH:quinone oxidoreductase family protein [Rhodospirillales bacterium]
MRALLCRQYGTPDTVKIENVDPPQLRPGTVRIAVRHAGVSFAVILGLAGKHQNKPGLPYIPGGEIAGAVLEIASDVTHVKPGDRVTALISSGGFAEQAVAPASTVWPIAEGMSDEAALSIASTYASIFTALEWSARLKSGETLLVHGAGGASGLGAVALGKAIGARVIATASSPAKRDMAARFGAVETIDYKNQDVRQRVLDLTEGRGVDVVFDPVGGELFDLSLRCVAPEGRLLIYGFASGKIPQIPANLLLVKNVSAIGYYWGYYMGWGRQAPPPGTIERQRKNVARLMEWSQTGRLPSLPAKIYALEDFAAAMGEISSREAIGKILLRL